MYKIPLEFDVNTLKGQLIIQIAFGLNYIIFLFDNGFVQLSGSFSIYFNNRKTKYNEVFPVTSDLGLLNLLEKQIIKAEVNENRSTLILEFEAGTTLELIGNEEYESYRIKMNGQEFII